MWNWRPQTHVTWRAIYLNSRSTAVMIAVETKNRIKPPINETLSTTRAAKAQQQAKIV